MANQEESSSIIPEYTDNTAREESNEQDKVQRSLEEGIKVQKSLEDITSALKVVESTLVIEEDLVPRCSRTLFDLRELVTETKDEPVRLGRFRDEILGQPTRKRFRANLEGLINETETLHISCNRGQKKRTIDAAVCYGIGGPQFMTISCAGWETQDRFVPQLVTAAVFAEQMKKERMASVCSYHEIKTKKNYFHCIWQIDNPAKSEFFRKPSRRSRTHNGSVSDVTIPGPIYEGAGNTTWQAIAYPYGYRSNNREGLVGKVGEKGHNYTRKNIL
ncbi:hypothetical protein RvY_10138 [Ramazzottius varieornatus]|uniref:Uncharacterized protein n=1 Tax=Ramazzottius varieornatus TaxID=947166 RepID=A0A1D1VBT4_RAMVA|nr:hypothetical protein RvY_10138 [Ramazzottius varieornatus]